MGTQFQDCWGEYEDNCFSYYYPVSECAVSASALGILNLVGNAQLEWVHDLGVYPESPTVNPYRTVLLDYWDYPFNYKGMETCQARCRDWGLVEYYSFRVCRIAG